jgi:hypothetical protein
MILKRNIVENVEGKEFIDFHFSDNFGRNIKRVKLKYIIKRCSNFHFLIKFDHLDNMEKRSE